MKPVFLVLGQKIIFWQNVLTIIGVLLGAICLGIVIRRNAGDKKRFYILMGVYTCSIAFSIYGGKILRNIMQTENLQTFIQELFTANGIHFVGVVFTWLLLFPLIYCIVFRDYKYLLKEAGYGSVFFCVQHICNRLGCYCTGCCFGKPYAGIFSITFPDGSNPVRIYGMQQPLFPTQLLEAVGAAILLTISIILLFKYINPLSIFLAGFGLLIFFSEAFMYNEGDRMFFSLTYPQLAASGLILAGVLSILQKKRMIGREKNETRKIRA